MRFRIAAGLVPMLACSLLADNQPARQKPVIRHEYHGGFPDQFPALLTHVQTWTPLTQLDISSQLGFFQYREGFQHPVAIRFDDGAPALVENPFFYVVTAPAGQPFSQELVANVEAFAHQEGPGGDDEERLHQGFAYGMAELILNDLAGGEAAKAMPTWAQEGIAIYISGMGEALVRQVASKVTRSRVGELIDNLNRPLPVLTPRQYARYYLGVKYIAETGGTSGLQAFVRGLLSGRSAADSIRDVLGQEWPDFQNHVREFSRTSLMPFAREDEEPAPSH